MCLCTSPIICTTPPPIFHAVCVCTSECYVFIFCNHLPAHPFVIIIHLIFISQNVNEYKWKRVLLGVNCVILWRSPQRIPSSRPIRVEICVCMRVDSRCVPFRGAQPERVCIAQCDSFWFMAVCDTNNTRTSSIHYSSQQYLHDDGAHVVVPI